jgi:predicted deacylase
MNLRPLQDASRPKPAAPVDDEPIIDCDAQRALDLGRPDYARSGPAMNAQVRALARSCPSFIQAEDIGDSGLGRDILALRIGVPAEGGAKKPTLFIVAGQHAREIATPEVAMRFANLLASQFSKCPRITEALKRCDVVIVPVASPDGQARVLDGFRQADPVKVMHRTTVVSAGAPPGSEQGTDPNRNFPVDWDAPSSIDIPGSEFFRGFVEAGEPETVAIIGRAKEAELDERDIFLNVHAHGRAVVIPDEAAEAATAKGKRTVELARRVAKAMSQAGETHQAIPASALYETSGTSDAYMFRRHGAASLTLELGEDFHPSDEEFVQVEKEALAGLLEALLFLADEAAA